jgi:hypothetical protein
MIETEEQEPLHSTRDTISSPSFNTSSAGVMGILRKMDQSIKETDQTLDQAFKDVDALMEKAADLVNHRSGPT